MAGDRFDPDFFENFAAAGGVQNQEHVPETVTIEWLRVRCEELEQVLRLQDDDGKLDPEDEQELARYPLASMTSALRRWAFLKHIYFRDAEGLVRSTPGDKDEVVQQILDREPVRVWIANRWVSVTSRSRAALVALARHDLRRRDVQRDLDHAADLYEETERQLEQAGWRRKAALRRRLRRLRHFHSRAFRELLYHSRVIYANALTPSGRSAGPGDAPSWWTEITEADEAQLLHAVLTVGPLRYARLGPIPDDGQHRTDRPFLEPMGFWSVIAAYEKELNLRPAELQDQDLAQLLTWMRAGAPFIAPTDARPAANVPPGAEEPF